MWISDAWRKVLSGLFTCGGRMLDGSAVCGGIFHVDQRCVTEVTEWIVCVWRRDCKWTSGAWFYVDERCVVEGLGGSTMCSGSYYVDHRYKYQRTLAGSIIKGAVWWISFLLYGF